MDAELRDKTLRFASFLHDIVEATTTRQIWLRDQTRDGFIVRCDALPNVVSVSSPAVEQPDKATDRVLRVGRPGDPPKAPVPDADGAISSDEQERFDRECEAYGLHETLYNQLFDARTAPDGLELVFAVGSVYAIDDGKNYFRHIAVAPAQVQMDANDGRLTVELTGGFNREVNWLPGGLRGQITGLGEDALRNLTTADTIADASVALSELALALGPKVENGRSDKPDIGRVHLDTSPCVLLRAKDSSALLDLLIQLREDIEAGGEISEPFKVLADADYSPAPLEQAFDTTMLPLDANAMQRGLIERARQDRHVVIQGPPGTGKTHTIANLLSTLIAEGRRVLVTAESDRALSEVQGKLPEEMQALALPLLQDRQSAGLEKSVNGILERTSGKDFIENTRHQIDRLITELESCDTELLNAERALIDAATFDRDEREIGGRRFPLFGHQRTLQQRTPDLELVDKYLSPGGWISQTDADRYRHLAETVTDEDSELTRASFPQDLPSPQRFAEFISDYRSSLAQLPEGHGRPHQELHHLLGELDELSLLLERLGGTEWTAIGRSSAEYDEARTRAVNKAPDINHGVALVSGQMSSTATRMLVEFLDPAVARLAGSVPEALELHSRADTAFRAAVEPVPIRAGIDLATAFPVTEATGQLLRDDPTGLLEEHAMNRLAGRSGRVPGLCQDAAGLLKGTQLRPGLPVTIDGSEEATHELLRQAEALRDHLEAGGKFTRTFGTPAPVKDAAALIRAVRVGGSVIDTRAEVDRVIEVLTHRKNVEIVNEWAAQHGLVVAEGLTQATWLESFASLEERTMRLTESLSSIEQFVRQGAQVHGLSPKGLVDGISKSLGGEVVSRLQAFHDAWDAFDDEIRIAGQPVSTSDDARIALNALVARESRQGLAELLPISWQHIDPQLVEPDQLSTGLRAASIAAKVPGWARTSQLSAESVRSLIDQIKVDVRRNEILTEHAAMISEIQRKLAGCVPKSPGGLRLEQAVNDQDPTAFASATEQTRDESDRAKNAAELDRLSADLKTAHPGLLTAIDAGLAGAEDVLERIEELQRLRDYRSQVVQLGKQVIPAAEAHRHLAGWSDQRRRLEAKIAELRCWLTTAERLESRKNLRSALSALTTAVSSVPKTRTAKSYGRKVRALQEATERAAAAIPCLIMPISRAVELVGYPAPDQRFDVIIIDEASQAWFSASFLYALAEQVIVVGDDLQTSPADSIMKEDDITSVVREHIPQHPIGNLVGPDLSLYDVAVSMTGPDTMVDHFRCVPEIIGISNRLSYEPKNKTLLPARVRAGHSLTPVVYHRCHGARLNPKGPNEIEADELVDQVLACHNDPRYDGMEFGIVVASSQVLAHIQYLRGRLLDVVGPSVIQSRNIEIGTAARFQGAERHVMFLSLVDNAEASEILTSRPLEHTGKNRLFVQQLNVAVSRARDQLHIFHSFGLEHLRENDSRRVLLEAAPPASAEFENELKKCDSQFEIDVARALRLADPTFTITTQVEALGYRIDIVVETSTGYQLAVECDGDRWHSADEDMRRDLYRQRTLERIGWRFERFLASEWYADPERILRRVVSAARNPQAYQAPFAPSTAKVPSSPGSPPAAPPPSTAAPIPAKEPPTDPAPQATAPSQEPQAVTNVPSDPAPMADLKAGDDDVVEDAAPERTTRPPTVRPGPVTGSTAKPRTTDKRERPSLPVKRTRAETRDTNQELAAALRRLNKDLNGPTWERAKEFLDQGLSITEAARRA